MTLKQLRDALAKIDKRHDNSRVSIFLPGSRVDIEGVMGERIDHLPGSGAAPASAVLIEGNLRPGSALGG